MKFTAKKSVILEGLEKAAKGISNASSIPILGGILLKVTEEEVILTGASQDTSIRVVIAVDNEGIVVERPGATVIQKKSVEIVKKLKDGDIVFETDEKDYTTITSNSVEFVISGLIADEFPSLPEISKEDEPTIVLNGKEFQEIVKKTSFCAATSDTRPILKAVLFDLKEDCIDFIATDSHRLGKVSRSFANSKPESRIPIPSQSVIQMTKVFDFSADVEIFTLSDNQAIFCNGNITFYSRILEGNYPDTTRLIPNDFKTEITLNRKELEQALEQCSILADDGKSGVVKMEVEGLMVSLKSAVSQRGKGKVEIAYSNFEGEDLTISFSSKYALDSVKSYDTEEVALQFQGEMRPFLVNPVQTAEAINSLQLILPVRTTA